MDKLIDHYPQLGLDRRCPISSPANMKNMLWAMYDYYFKDRVRLEGLEVAVARIKQGLGYWPNIRKEQIVEAMVREESG